MADRPAPRAEPAGATSAPPRVLAGRYRLEQLLAGGGMGEVWAGVDLVLGRWVAVKLLRPELAADPQLVARFRREAVAAARLSHPSIVSVYDTVSDGGTEAVVMQLVRGRSLRQVLDAEGRLTPGTVRRLGRALADALEAAHAAGVVHRDVKPGNVLLTPDGRVLLADFGLAKVLDTDDGLSVPRAMVGTAKYLAPEQVEGAPVDGRADLYALGIVLYECLTGRVPFWEATDTDTARARLDRPAPPVRSLKPGVPRPLADLVDQLLERASDDRPPSAAVVRDQLDRMVFPGGHEEPPLPVDPSPLPGAVGPDGTPPVPYGHVHPPRQHRGWVAAAGMILLVAGVLLAAGVVLSRTGPGDRLLDRVTGGGATATTAAPTTVADAPTTVARGPSEVVSAGEFDPPPAGDGKENPDRIGLLTDGDTTTTWTTLCYESPTFLPKEGVGLLFELSGAAAGHDLIVSALTEALAADVYVADRPAATLTGWGLPVSSRDDLVPGTVRFPLGSSKGRYVLLFLREAGPSERCSKANPYQARIAEVSVAPQR